MSVSFGFSVPLFGSLARIVRQGLRKIGQDILDLFPTDRKAGQTRADAMQVSDPNRPHDRVRN